MTATTAWERKQRRQEVVRLRAQGFSTDEIAEETGYSEKTIRRDIKRINDELSKWGDEDHLRRLMRDLMQKLYEEEFEDLRAADLEGDEKAKHRAKSSARQTLELMEKIEKEFYDSTDSDMDSWFKKLPESLQNDLADEAGEAVERFLFEEAEM